MRFFLNSLDYLSVGSTMELKKKSIILIRKIAATAREDPDSYFHGSNSSQECYKTTQTWTARTLLGI